MQVSLRASLNTCSGVVRFPNLNVVNEEEILEEMKEQGVIHVRRIKVRRDDALKDTNTFMFTFNTSVLPKQLKVAFLRVSVDPYIPNPLRCYACQVFGHHENKCHREEISANCAQAKNSADETDCKRPAKCFNCTEDHPANSAQCQAWHTEKQILVVRWSWVNFQCRGVLLLGYSRARAYCAVGAGGGCLDIFTLLYLSSSLSPSLWETARYRLKYCLKGPLNPKQPTNQPEG